MKLQFKHQSFQVEAARAVVDAFLGQPLQDAFTYRMDVGNGGLALEAQGFRNQELQLSDAQLTEISVPSRRSRSCSLSSACDVMPMARWH